MPIVTTGAIAPTFPGIRGQFNNLVEPAKHERSQAQERRLVFRKMSYAIHGLSIATASSVLLWTVGGGGDAPLPPLASAATKSEKQDKNSPQGDAPDSEPATGGRPHQEETKTVSLDYFSTPWAKVLMDLAEQTHSELVVDRVRRPL